MILQLLMSVVTVIAFSMNFIGRPIQTCRSGSWNPRCKPRSGHQTHLTQSTAFNIYILYFQESVPHKQGLHACFINKSPWMTSFHCLSKRNLGKHNGDWVGRRSSLVMNTLGIYVHADILARAEAKQS